MCQIEYSIVYPRGYLASYVARRQVGRITELHTLYCCIGSHYDIVDQTFVIGRVERTCVGKILNCSTMCTVLYIQRHFPSQENY